MTLNEVMKETADAIREKTGKSELIAPVDFASEIKGITAGGGDAPSGVRSSWRYFDVSKAVEGLSVRTVFPTLVRVSGSAEIYSALTLEADRWNSVTAFGVDGDGILVAYDGIPYTWNEGMALEGFTPENLPQFGITEITENEFLTKTFE
jgi:hypothetical protein